MFGYEDVFLLRIDRATWVESSWKGSRKTAIHVEVVWRTFITRSLTPWQGFAR